MKLQVAVKRPFPHGRCSFCVRRKWKDNPVCKLLLVWRGGVMEKGSAGVFSRAVVNPQPLTGYPGEVQDLFLCGAFSAMAVGAGTGPAILRSKILSAG